MNHTFISSIMTVILFAIFLGIWAWAWNGKQKSRFDEAAQLPFEDEHHSHKTNLEERKQ
ncbi:MAG: cbb3-type cytochrome oxidase subunit 3 [bacterium]